ncbi:MAG: type II secretion system protein [Longimicrobiales bacterium]
MGGKDPGRWADTDRPGARGFTLIELLLVTVVVGILAMIVAPYFGRARERAYLAQMQAEARHLMEGVETYLSLNNGAFPTSIADLEANSSFTHTTDVQYCVFTSVPRTAVRDPYIIAMAGHAGTTTKVFIAYPLWGSRIIDFDSGRRGC